MNENDQKQNIVDNVLKKVREGGVRMHPKMYFIARLIGVIVIAFLVLAISALVASFIFFSIHESGEQFLLGFGGRGVLTFFSLFPWIFILIDIVLIVLLEWLVQSFKFGYRISLLKIFLGILISSIVLGVIIDLTPLHTALLDRADNGQLPIIGELYENIRNSHEGQGVFRGTITSMQGNEIVIFHDDNDHDQDDGTRTVILSSIASSTFQLGDRVYVYGKMSNGLIEAQGVQKLSADQ